MTPAPQFGFQFISGDNWCLCAARWLEACHNGRAPVYLMRTRKRALEIVPLEKLKQHAADIN